MAESAWSYSIFSKCGRNQRASVEYRWKPKPTWSKMPPESHLLQGVLDHLERARLAAALPVLQQEQEVVRDRELRAPPPKPPYTGS